MVSDPRNSGFGNLGQRDGNAAHQGVPLVGQNQWDPRVASPLTMAVMKALQACPDGCTFTTMMQGVPPPGPITLGMTLPFARCIRCLTYWEVTLHDAKAVNIRWGFDSRHRAGLPAPKPTPPT